MESDLCPFCNVDLLAIVASNAAAIGFHDAFPLAHGHTLIVPRRHVASVFDLSGDEQDKVWQLVAQVRNVIKKQFSPAGFNIGINDGESAGQTVPHAHVHVIPRYRGDVPDPRGGVRWVIPHQAAYWEHPS